MNSKRYKVFIVELFILSIILMALITIITALSMETREQSVEAGRLTDAVLCAENTAEMTSEAASVKQAAKMIGKMDNVSEPGVSGNVISAKTRILTEKGESRVYIVKVTIDVEKGSSGRYIKKKIEVFSGEDADKIYELDTGNYIGRDAA